MLVSPLKKPYHKKIYFGVTSCSPPIHGSSTDQIRSHARQYLLREKRPEFSGRDPKPRISSNFRQKMPNLTDAERPRSFARPCLFTASRRTATGDCCLPYGRATPPKSTGLQQDQMQTCVVAPMATPTTNRILQKQQPVEILYAESGPAEPRRRTLRTNHRVYPLINSPEYRRNVARMKDT
jgi:hypothetical protein